MTRQALATTALSRRGCSAAAARAMTVPPRVQVTDELADYQVAHRELVPSVQHCRSMYLNNRGRELPSADPATRAGDVNASPRYRFAVWNEITRVATNAA